MTITVMGIEARLSNHSQIDGVDYELYETIDGEGVFRIADPDTGEAIGMVKYATLSKATEAYDTAVSRAQL